MQAMQAKRSKNSMSIVVPFYVTKIISEVPRRMHSRKRKDSVRPLLSQRRRATCRRHSPQDSHVAERLLAAERLL